MSTPSPVTKPRRSIPHAGEHGRLECRVVSGASYYPEGIETSDRMANLTAGLLRSGFGEADVRKVPGLNWLRVYRAVWG